MENQISLLNCFYLLVTLMNQRAYDLFRVMDIHLAAKGFEVKGLM